MDSILDYDDLSIFNNFEELESIFGDNFQYTDYDLSKKPIENPSTIIQFDLNNIFDSSSESEINSPNNQLLNNDEIFSNNHVPFDSENLMKSLDSKNYSLNDSDDINNSQDTFLNIEINDICESDNKHIFINLEDLNHFEDLSSESESCRVLNKNKIFIIKDKNNFFKSEDAILTEEEKNIYLKEGYKIPTVKPLTKVLIKFLI